MNKFDQAIENVIRKKFDCATVHKRSQASVSTLNRCSIFETDKGTFFVKANDESRLTMYEAEAKGLQHLRNAGTLRVPAPLYWGVAEGQSYLILEYISLFPHSPKSQRELGSQLAKMHLMKGAKDFGFEVENTIGTMPQINIWSGNWVEFFLKNRLEFQLRLLEKRKGDSEILSKGMKFIERYRLFFDGVDIVPSLLHGDLWGGNTAADEKGRAVIFDPAAYFGHHEAEFGILLMFGGFSQDFHEAYRALIPKSDGFEERQLGYQLYHYLNHYNIFGSSYRPSSMAILTRL